MTATTASVVVPQPLPSDSKSKLGWAVSDTMAIVKRNLITLKRVPQLLIFSTVQPVIFVLLFVYVFGGAIPIPGVTYVNYLMPGIFLQTVTFGAVNTGIGLADDLNKGFIERFRSLPMARSAVLAGRTVADLIRNLVLGSQMVQDHVIHFYHLQALDFVNVIGASKADPAAAAAIATSRNEERAKEARVTPMSAGEEI